MSPRLTISNNLIGVKKTRAARRRFRKQRKQRGRTRRIHK